MTARGVSSTRPLSPIGWLGAPMLLAMLATLVLSTPTPIRLFGFGLPQPVFGLALAFAWALIRPSVLPPFALLILGLFLDVLWDGPQGLWPLCLLSTYAAVLLLRPLITGQDFVVMWVIYAAAIGLAFGVGFTLMAMDTGGALSLAAIGWQYLWTLLLFPFAYRLFERYEDADVRFR
jgi:rod shape-determining protein MreD